MMIGESSEVRKHRTGDGRGWDDAVEQLYGSGKKGLDTGKREEKT